MVAEAGLNGSTSLLGLVSPSEGCHDKSVESYLRCQIELLEGVGDVGDDVGRYRQCLA